MNEEKDPQKLALLLKDYGDSGLRKIVRHTQRLSALNQILAQCLPENLRAHCQVGQFSVTEITILVESAAWLTHLRYLKSQILQSLKKQPQCNYLQEVHFRIKLSELIKEQSQVKQISQKMSADNKELLQNVAETVENLALKAALLRLAKGN